MRHFRAHWPSPSLEESVQRPGIYVFVPPTNLYLVSAVYQPLARC